VSNAEEMNHADKDQDLRPNALVVLLFETRIGIVMEMAYKYLILRRRVFW